LPAMDIVPSASSEVMTNGANC